MQILGLLGMYFDAAVVFVTNSSILFRFTMHILCDKGVETQYQPPSLDLYTIFPLQTYFLAFWVVLFLHTLTIFIIDKIWLENIPQSATIWERFIHAIEKSQLPFPYSNWHESNGDCNDHVKKHKAAQIEVLITMAINSFFNMVLLIPLVILCKIHNTGDPRLVQFHLVNTIPGISTI